MKEIGIKFAGQMLIKKLLRGEVCKFSEGKLLFLDVTVEEAACSEIVVKL